MCRVLGVSRSGFYAWSTRAPSDRALHDAWLIEQIGEIHAANRGVYGSPRVQAEVRMARGIRVVGWSMADHMRSDLVVDALNMAVARRRPDAALIHHSDQGSHSPNSTGPRNGVSVRGI